MENTKKLLLLFLITFASIPAIYGGNKEDLKHFAETGECEGCNLAYEDLREIIMNLRKQDPDIKINLIISLTTSNKGL